MPLFKHYILTRFNIVYSDWKKQFPDHPVFTSRNKWTDDRLSLFENYCLPSVQNQACLDFQWIIAFDESTGPEHRKRIDRYSGRFDRIVVLYSNEKKYMTDIKTLMGTDHEYLITTRLDSDDVLHCQAVHSLQAAFRKQEFEFLNFQNGYKYDFKNNRLIPASDHSSPFATLIEKRSDAIRSVMCEEHHKIYKEHRSVQLRDRRYWLQIVHGLNLMNKVRDPVSVPALVRHFLRSPGCSLCDCFCSVPYDMGNKFLSQKDILLSFGIRAVSSDE